MIGHNARKQDMKKSAKEVTAVVSVMDIWLAIVVDLIVYIKELGGEVGECIYRLAQPESKETLRAIANLIVKDQQKLKDNRIWLSEAVALSLTDLISAGKYDLVNSDIKDENFPIDESINPNEKTHLFHFDREMSSDAIKVEMDKEGWKPATIWHLLILGIKNPELQKQFPIIALGSVWRGLVPYLYWHDFGRKRSLNLNRVDDGWLDHCRFLAVRK